MKNWILGAVAASALVASCSPEPLPITAQHCQAMVIEALRSPSSFELVTLNRFEDDMRIFIEYDAQNGFGAQIRQIARCEYVDELGVPTVNQFIVAGEEYDQRALSLISIGAQMEIGVGRDQVQ